MAKIFISYSSSDVDFAKKLVRWLEGKGHHIWIDKKMILAGATRIGASAGIKIVHGAAKVTVSD